MMWKEKGGRKVKEEEAEGEGGGGGGRKRRKLGRPCTTNTDCSGWLGLHTSLFVEGRVAVIPVIYGSKHLSCCCSSLFYYGMPNRCACFESKSIRRAVACQTTKRLSRCPTYWVVNKTSSIKKLCIGALLVNPVLHLQDLGRCEIVSNNKTRVASEKYSFAQLKEMFHLISSFKKGIPVCFRLINKV